MNILNKNWIRIKTEILLQNLRSYSYAYVLIYTY